MVTTSPSIGSVQVKQPPVRKRIGRNQKSKCKNPKIQLHNKQSSVSRLRISIARDQEHLKRLEMEEAALKKGGTERLTTRTKRVVEEASPEPQPKRTKQDEGETRVVIKYFYKQLGSPPEEDWDGHYGTISEIRKRMGNSAPGWVTVRRTLELLAAEYMDVMVRGTPTRKRELSDEDDLYVGLLLCEGYSQRDALDALNADRAEDGLDPVSRQQVRDAETRVGLKRRRRRGEKSGSVDEQSDWAQASLAQSLQFKDQVRRGLEAQAPALERRQIKVGSKHVLVDATDDWGVLGKDIGVYGRWWEDKKMSKKDKNHPWPCKLAAFSSSYHWPKGEVLPTYFIESQGHLYPMRASVVYGYASPAMKAAIDAAGAASDELPPPFVLEQVLWLDEFHKKCILGKVSQFDCTLSNERWQALPRGGRRPAWRVEQPDGTEVQEGGPLPVWRRREA